MRRADRLFRIIQHLRGRRRAVTAAELADALEVSERTVYRDIRDLVASGTPIVGEAGVGYALRREYDLPPLMFDEDEVEALVFGARLVMAHGDEVLARAARSVLSKVEAVLPPALERRPSESALYVPGRAGPAADLDTLSRVRAALTARRKLTFAYENGAGEASERTVWPLGAFFWGRTWTLAAWCELREDFRNFRIDRIREERLEEPFERTEGRTLRDYLARYGPDAVALLDG